MSVSRQVELQKQAIDNAEDLQFFLRDLKQWEAQIKAKDSELSEHSSETLEKEYKGPIRGQTEEDETNEKVKKALDREEKIEESSESDEDTVILRAKQQAIVEKDKGNAFLKAGKLDKAIDCYTNGQQLDPYNPLLPANRALALLKRQQYGAAEVDCSLALAIDPTYVKAYQRRAAARVALKKLVPAKEDLLAVLRLEPNNNEAKVELSKVNQALAKEDQVVESAPKEVLKEGERIPIHPVEKPEHLKSKKPLQRIKVVDIAEEPSSVGDPKPKFQSPKPRLEQADISRTKVVVPELPKVPTSSYQFQTDFRRLKSHPELLYRYIKQIPSGSYSQLFQHNLEPDILSQMLVLFLDYFMWNGDDLYEPLLNLTRTKRFSALKMFLSDKDKQVLQEIFEHMIKINQGPLEDVQSLMQTYDLG